MQSAQRLPYVWDYDLDLGEFREIQVRDRLLETYGDEKSYFAFNQAVRALARQGDPSALEIIEKSLKMES